MKHDKHLNTLLQSYLQACGDTLDQRRLFWLYLCGLVPEPEALRVFQEQGLKFTGKESSFGIQVNPNSGKTTGPSILNLGS